MYDAKIIGHGEEQEILVGISPSAMRKAETLSLSRDALLQTLRMGAVQIRKEQEDQLVVLKKTTAPITFDDESVVDYTKTKVDGGSIQKAMEPFVVKEDWQGIRRALENYIGVDFSAVTWKNILSELKNPKGDIGRAIREISVPSAPFSILLNVSQKGKASMYIDVITIRKDFFVKDQAVKVIELAA